MRPARSRCLATASARSPSRATITRWCASDLAPGQDIPYDVGLDGRRVWPPPDDSFPQPAIRTLDGRGPFRVAFGSCRVALPHRPPYTPAKDEHRRAGVRRRLHPGQVYVDEGSPAARKRIRATRDTSAPPGQGVANFEEYTWLYHESWGDPVIRWLLSTIPTAMVLDDHDMADDWNISGSWKEEMNRRQWWRERLAGGLMSYWIYQHIGNLAPEELERHEEYDAVRRAGDGGAARGWSSSTIARAGASRRAPARSSTTTNGTGS